VHLFRSGGLISGFLSRLVQSVREPEDEFGRPRDPWRGMAMVQAFVLIQAGVGMASRVGQAVGAIQGVRSADIVTGP
jgi:hypothetical protein